MPGGEGCRRRIRRRRVPLLGPRQAGRADQWLACVAAWLGWTLDSFDFTIFLLLMVPIAKGFGDFAHTAITHEAEPSIVEDTERPSGLHRQVEMVNRAAHGMRDERRSVPTTRAATPFTETR